MAGIIGLAYRYLNRDFVPLQYLQGSSFGVYMFHFLPVTVLGYLLLGLPLHFYLRFGLTVLLSYPAAFALYEGPGLRFLFGIKGVQK